MTNPEENQPIHPIIKTIVPATILSAVAIGLFVALYFLLAQSDVAPFPRLMISLCVPPAILAILVGFYFLFGPRRNQNR